MSIFNNVTNQMSSWFGGVIKRTENGKHIDGSSKNDTNVEKDTVNVDASQSFVESGEAVQPVVESMQKNDDSSSTTEGADSECASIDSADAFSRDHNPFPTLESISSGIEDVSNKALQRAKNFGNLLFTAVNKAGKTVTEAGAKIKKTVGETERRNFLRSPPPEVEFVYDKDLMHPIAMATLSEDSNLQEMRFQLVPKEYAAVDNSLICQSSQLSSHDQGSVEGLKDSSKSSSFESDQVDEVPSLSDSPHEFVSDSFQVTSQDMEEVKAGMKLLGMERNTSEKDWEKELQAELQEYEVVNGQHLDSSDWDAEIQQMLEVQDLASKESKLCS